MRNLIAGVVAAATLVACSSAGGDAQEPESADRPHEPNVVYRLDPETESVLGEMPVQAKIDVGAGFGRVIVDEDVWVLNSFEQSVSRIDVATNAVTATIPIESGTASGDLALAAGDAWVTNPDLNNVSRIDHKTNKEVATLPSQLLPQGIVELDGDVWVANHHGRDSGSVWRIEPDTNKVVARIPVGNTPDLGPQWMAASAGSLWVGVPGLEAVVRIDPGANAIANTIPVPSGAVCGQLFADDDAVYVAAGMCGDGAVTRIDTITNQIAARISSELWGTSFGGTAGFGSVWVSTDGGPVEIDPATNEVVSRLVLGDEDVFGGDMTTGADSLWIHDAEKDTLLRVTPPA